MPPSQLAPLLQLPVVGEIQTNSFGPPSGWILERKSSARAAGKAARISAPPRINFRAMGDSNEFMGRHSRGVKLTVTRHSKRIPRGLGGRNMRASEWPASSSWIAVRPLAMFLGAFRLSPARHGKAGFATRMTSEVLRRVGEV